MKLDEYKKNLLGDKLAKKDRQKAFLAFEISANTSFRTEIRQVPKRSLNDLIAQLGDYLATFLGMSILSSFEIIDLIVSIASVYKPAISSPLPASSSLPSSPSRIITTKNKKIKPTTTTKIVFKRRNN